MGLSLLFPANGCGLAKLIYSAFTSLDGFVADENGNFDWAELGVEVFGFIDDRERLISTYHFGCKMYETRSFSAQRSDGNAFLNCTGRSRVDDAHDATVVESGVDCSA